MTRFLGLAALGLALFAGSASANGWPQGCCIHPGYLDFRFNASVNWGSFGYGGGAPVTPYQLGPWYQYWPYEAHFQTPAMPMYPYWSAMTLPNGSPVINPGYPGHGAVPNYWQPDK